MRYPLIMIKNQAIKLFCRGEKDEAYKLFKSLEDKTVEDADVYCHMGIIHEEKGELPEAIKYYKKALSINPSLVPALANLGNQLKNSGYLSQAFNNFAKAFEIAPNSSLLCSNFANILINMAEHKKAYQKFLTSLKLMPNNLNAYSNFLLSLNYTNIYNEEEIFSFHKKFSKAIGENEKQLKGYNHNKLRVAYLSGDFKKHSVSYFIEGVLHFHNRNKFDVYCYSDVLKVDEVTEKISSKDLTFKDIKYLSDLELNKLILKDEIDILIDLGGHTSKRLKILALRSAPVQISYLGYGNTTGLKNIDYRIVDTITDTEQSLASENLIRLNRSFLAFCPPEESIDIIDSPATKNGYITFGSFNNLPKLTDEVLRLWIRIMKQTPNSRIILKTKAFIDPNIKTSILHKFTSRGVSAERVNLIGRQRTTEEHLLNYQKIDIALDPFPYNGTTTTCEALHMGVPIICLKGKSHIARVSASLLEHTGLQSLVALDKKEYIKIAVELARRTNLLNEFHHKIRTIMHSSQICDSKSLTLELEKVYLGKAKRPAEADLL